MDDEAADDAEVAELMVLGMVRGNRADGLHASVGEASSSHSRVRSVVGEVDEPVMCIRFVIVKDSGGGWMMGEGRKS